MTIRTPSFSRGCIDGAPTGRSGTTIAAERLRWAQRPLIIAGGGVRYSRRQKVRWKISPQNSGIRWWKPLPAKALSLITIRCIWARSVFSAPLPPMSWRPMPDVILAIGTRLMDFVTGSWTVFSHDAQFITLNAARFDAHKRLSLRRWCATLAKRLNDLRGAGQLAGETPRGWREDVRLS